MSDSELVAEQEATPVGPGATLKAAREAIGVSRREIGEALNLPIETLTALEEDDQEAQPEAVFARGYVRSYAKLLDLDPEPLVALVGRGKGSNISMGPVPISEPKNFRGPLLAGAGVAVLLVIAGVTALMSGDSEESTPTEEVAVVGPAAANVETPEQFVVNTGLSDETPGAVDGVSAPEESVSASASQVPELQPDVALAAPVAAVASISADVAEPVADGTFRRITPTGDDQLVMTFTADCWVEVTTPAKERLYGNLGSTTRTIRLIGQAPFRLNLGYAPAATVLLNGESIPLVPHTRNNVARLVVGQ